MHQDGISSRAPRRHKLTVEEFCALADAGFFEGKGRFELIEGEVYKTSPLHVPHARAMRVILTELDRAIADSGLPLEVVGTVSLRLGARSLPEPDLWWSKLALRTVSSTRGRLGLQSRWLIRR